MANFLNQENYFHLCATREQIFLRVVVGIYHKLNFDQHEYMTVFILRTMRPKKQNTADNDRSFIIVIKNLKKNNCEVIKRSTTALFLWCI